MTCAQENASTAVRLPLWDYPTQDIARIGQSKAISNTATPTNATPSPDVADLLTSRAKRIHQHNGLARKRYLAVCQALKGGCSIET
jgi:hypothetical protein